MANTQESQTGAQLARSLLMEHHHPALDRFPILGVRLVTAYPTQSRTPLTVRQDNLYVAPQKPIHVSDIDTLNALLQSLEERLEPMGEHLAQPFFVTNTLDIRLGGLTYREETGVARTRPVIHIELGNKAQHRAAQKAGALVREGEEMKPSPVFAETIIHAYHDWDVMKYVAGYHKAQLEGRVAFNEVMEQAKRTFTATQVAALEIGEPPFPKLEPSTKKLTRYEAQKEVDDYGARQVMRDPRKLPHNW